MDIEEMIQKLDVTMGAIAEELKEMTESDSFNPETALQSLAQCNLEFFDLMVSQLMGIHHSMGFAEFIVRGLSINIVNGFNDRLDNPEKYYDAPGSVNVIDTK